MSEALEHLEVKFVGTAGDEGTFTAYAATFGNVDRGGDAIKAGAFARTLADWKARGQSIPLLWAHDPAQPIGLITEAVEDAKGLKVTGKLVLDVARGAEAYALMKAGALSSLSIGYRTIKASQGQGGSRVIEDADLFEISAVAVPMNPLATIGAVKAANAADPENLADRAAITTKGEQPVDNDNHAAMASLEERLTAVEAEAKGYKDRADELELKLNRPAPANDGAVTAEAKAFLAYCRTGADAMGDERKDLTTSDNTAGGYLAHPELVMEMERNLVEQSPVRSAARVSNTAKGSVILPKRTSGPTAYWVGETEARTETQPAYGQLELTVHELACYVDVSNALLEDADFNLEAELAADFAEEFGAKEGAAFVGGDGNKKPLGLTNSGVSTVANGHATVLSADALIGVLYDLPQAYRRNAVFGMNAASIATVRKLKTSGSGEYIWRPSLAEGQPETLLGRPLIEMPDMPDIGAAAVPIVVGDFSKFRIFDRIGLSVLRDPFSVQTSGLVRFHARRRVAAGVSQAEAFRLLSMEV